MESLYSTLKKDTESFFRESSCPNSRETRPAIHVLDLKNYANFSFFVEDS